MEVVISGGGTGGHIYPALAIAERLRSQGARILYMGGADSLEQRLAAARGFDFSAVRASGLHRRSPRLFKDLCVNYQGFKEARSLFARSRPDMVIGTGGYAAAPVIKAAQSLGIPTLLHEQNAFPGLANRALARKADAICLTFAAAGTHLPHPERQHVTGLPVRQAIIEADREAARRFFNIAPDDNAPCLLITGGSAGAASLNKAAEAAWPRLLQQGLRIIHICGRDNYFELKQRRPEHERLLLLPYVDEMENALAAADLAVARAGASFLSEAALLGLPLILVPYPYAANDHQRYNAQAFADSGAATVIDNAEINGKSLADTALALLTDRERLKSMSEQARGLSVPDAAQRITAITYDILAKKA